MSSVSHCSRRIELSCATPGALLDLTVQLCICIPHTRARTHHTHAHCTCLHTHTLTTCTHAHAHTTHMHTAHAHTNHIHTCTCTHHTHAHATNHIAVEEDHEKREYIPWPHLRIRNKVPLTQSSLTPSHTHILTHIPYTLTPHIAFPLG